MTNIYFGDFIAPPCKNYHNRGCRNKDVLSTLHRRNCAAGVAGVISLRVVKGAGKVGAVHGVAAAAPDVHDDVLVTDRRRLAFKSHHYLTDVRLGALARFLAHDGVDGAFLGLECLLYPFFQGKFSLRAARHLCLGAVLVRRARSANWYTKMIIGVQRTRGDSRGVVEEAGRYASKF
jgi:hypothetical protein